MNFAEMQDMDLLQFVSADDLRHEQLADTARLLDSCVRALSAETLAAISIRPKVETVSASFRVVLLAESSGRFLGIRTDTRRFIEAYDSGAGFWSYRALGSAVDALSHGWNRPDQYLADLNTMIQQRFPQRETTTQPEPLPARVFCISEFRRKRDETDEKSK